MLNMPGKRCSISTCKNSRGKTGAGVIYHAFPKNKKIRHIWVSKCRRGTKWNPNNGAVCSVHFKADDYERDLKAELLHLPRKPRLKPTAIPTLNMSASTNNKTSRGPTSPNIKASNFCNKNIESDESSDQESEVFEFARAEAANRASFEKEIDIPNFEHEIEVSDSEEVFDDNDEIRIEELDIGDNRFAVEVFEDPMDEDTSDSDPETEVGMVEISTQTDFELPKNEPSVDDRIPKLEKMLRDGETEASKLRGRISALEYRLHKATTVNKELERVKEGISEFLSQTQMDYGVFKNKDVIWTSDDICKAFTIRYFNSRCYTYMKDTLKYPLPDVPSLQRWVSRINLKQGILEDVLKIMKIAGYAMTDFDKTVVLQFGETTVCPLYEYDEIQDEVLGPHSTMQIIIARGLFADWKQPIYIGFDTKITEEVLLKVTEQLYQIGYNVVAGTSNCVKTNSELWKELAINIQEPFFLHPVTNSKIYFFVDSSYLLLELHKWFTTTGFLLEGVEITKEPVEQFIADGADSECELTQQHLVFTQLQRQNIEMVSQVFSQACAMGLKGCDSEQIEVTRSFIEKISSWFELMSSNLPSDEPYGCDLENQNQILDSVYNTVMSLRCIGKTNMLNFQKGILISINSLKQLFNSLKQKCSANQILTSRLNLDSLEDLLSHVRGDKGIVPSPLESVYKIRNLLLGDNISQGNLSERDVLKNEYVLTKVLTADILIINPELIKPDSKSGCGSEQDVLQYLPAWVATKYKDVYPYLGNQMRGENYGPDYVLPSWLHCASFEQIIKPSAKWSRHTELINEIFNFHHESVFKKIKNVIDNLIHIVIKQYGNMIPKEVIGDFVTQRTLIKLMYLNKKLKLDVAGSKRKLVNEDELTVNKTVKNM